jgi:hypothetical protein
MSEWRDIVQIVVEKFQLHRKEDHDKVRVNLRRDVGVEIDQG